MKRVSRCGFLLVVMFLVILMSSLSTAVARDRINYGLPEGVYIDLTKAFYEALKEEGEAGSKTYANDMSQEYLRQIAVSAKFMVETNLRILKNQERIIRLLKKNFGNQEREIGGQNKLR